MAGVQELLADWHRLRELGLLAYGGGVLEQPAVWLEAMDLITDELAKCGEIAKAIQTAEKGVNDGQKSTNGRRGDGR